MTKVNVAQFKAQLSRYLRRVRRGQEVVVTDRDTPVARVVPFREHKPVELAIRRGQNPQSIAQLKFPPIKGKRIDSLALLLRERRNDR